MNKQQKAAMVSALRRGATSRQRKKFALKNPNKTNQEIADELGVTLRTVSEYREGTEYKLANVKKATNQRWQLKVSKLLTSQGICNKIVNRSNLHDIELENGKRATVFFRKKAYKQGGYPCYWFKIKKNLRGDYSDFFLLVARNSSSIYVIPNEEVGMISSVNISALPTKDKKKKKTSRYEKFLNAFYLLRQESQNAVNPV